MKLSISNIRNMLADDQEELVKAYIDTFSCAVEQEDGSVKELNPDIEKFLKTNAIQFAKMKTAVTYLVLDADDGALLGYFALAHKPLEIPADGLTRKIKDQIKRFSQLDGKTNTYTVSAFLLGQFGKNYAIDNGKRISGADLMEAAMDQLQDAQDVVGGTIFYLDCEADANLIRFYESQRFTLFGERISEKDGKRYLQYLNFI